MIEVIILFAVLFIGGFLALFGERFYFGLAAIVVAVALYVAVVEPEIDARKNVIEGRT